MTEASGAESVNEDERAEASSSVDRPWYRHPYLAIGLVVVSIALGTMGVSRFSAAGTERDLEAIAADELSALEAEESGLLDDLRAVEGEIAATESEAAGLRDEITVVEEAVAVAEAETEALESEIAEAEAPIRLLQRSVWGMYGALQDAAEMENGLAADLESAVEVGNVRDVDGMESRVEDLRDVDLEGLVEALGALDLGIADAMLALAGNGGSFEIAEDFETGAVGWEAGDSDGTAGPEDGGYLVTTEQPLQLMWAVSPYEVDDVTIEITAQATQGDPTAGFAYGVLCRAVETDYLAGYLFAVTSDGDFMVGWYRPPGDWVEVAFGSSGAITGGLDAHRISVTCNGPELTFRVAGATVWEGFDYNLSSGSVAVGAWSYDDTPVTVRFDDLTLTQGGE